MRSFIQIAAWFFIKATMGCNASVTSSNGTSLLLILIQGETGSHNA